MHTEEEAKTKWCPEVRVLYVEKMNGRVAAVNREPQLGDPMSKSVCIGSHCMAWRWVNAPGPRPHDAPEEIYRGYCGKAGKP